MPRRILIILGHPDGRQERLCRALVEAYAEGARSAGHEVRLIDVATLDFPILRSMEEFTKRPLPVTLQDAAQAIRDAEHLLFVFPLWLAPCPLC
jgi:putative NADPH-quinone reductase